MKISSYFRILPVPNGYFKFFNGSLSDLDTKSFLGLGLILVPVLILLFSVYKEYLKGEARNNNISNWIYLAIIMTVIIQFFPFKSSGSFFSSMHGSFRILKKAEELRLFWLVFVFIPAKIRKKTGQKLECWGNMA